MVTVEDMRRFSAVLLVVMASMASSFHPSEHRKMRSVRARSDSGSLRAASGPEKTNVAPLKRTTRRVFFSKAAIVGWTGGLLGSGLSAIAEEEGQAFDYGSYFGPFSCEWWGLERVKGSNQCKDRPTKKAPLDALEPPTASAPKESEKTAPRGQEGVGSFQDMLRMKSSTT